MENPGGVQPVHVWYTLIVCAAGVMGFLWRISRRLKTTNDVIEKFMIEHEILINWHCKETGITPDQLPTRLKDLRKW